MNTPGEYNCASATPSNTTVTLATPDPVHTQLGECRNPPRFIFYPISWDGSEDPATQNKKTATSSDVPADYYVDNDQSNSPSAVFFSTDTFWSIDRWRRDVVKCDDITADLLDPIHGAETLPLLSFPHDDHGGSQSMNEKPLRHTDSSVSEDDVQLCIHP